MNEKTRSMFRSWSRMPAFHARVQDTISLLQEWFQGHENVSVAVSGGKDSIVMLDLALKVNPDVFVWHWDFGIFMLRRFETAILDCLANHFKIHPDRLKIGRRLSNDPSPIAGYKAMFGAISRFQAENHVTLNLLGFRAEESCARRKRASKMFERKGNVTNIFPMKDWTWKDVWAHIVVNDIPYPDSYDLKAPLLGWDKVRFVSFFDPEFEHLGGPVQDEFFLFMDRER